MIDFCPRCRIQAPHDARRSGCPRCHGPLAVLESIADIPPRPSATPVPGAPTAASGRPRGPAPTVYRNAQRPARRPYPVRWVARRPPEAMPSPRPADGPVLTPTPRYAANPGWGLIDVIAEPVVIPRSRTQRLADAATPLVLTTAGTLVVAAVAQAWIYALLVINRQRPIGDLTASSAYGLAWAVGVVTIIEVVVCAVAFACWLWHRRARAYAAIDRVDPRPPWHIAVGTVVPVVNLVGAPVLIHELVTCRRQLADGDGRTRERMWPLLRPWWSAWVGVNVVAVLTISVRFGADSIQWSANGVLLAVLTDLCGAAFAVWTAWVMYRHVDAPQTVPTTRWLAA